MPKASTDRGDRDPRAAEDGGHEVPQVVQARPVEAQLGSETSEAVRVHVWPPRAAFDVAEQEGVVGQVLTEGEPPLA